MSVKRLLIVDDDETFRLIVKESLSRHGFAVEEAADGAQGFEAARHAPPDVIMVDVMMPGQDGVALCRQFRSEESLKTVPILVVTALSDQRVLQDALRFGADDYLLKPVDAPLLRAKIEKLLSSRRP